MKLAIPFRPTALALGLALVVTACGQSKNVSAPTDEEIAVVVKQYRQMILSEPHNAEADLVDFVSARKANASVAIGSGATEQLSVPVVLTYRAVGDGAEYSCVTGASVPDPRIRLRAAQNRNAGRYVPIRKGETFSCENKIVFRLTEYGWIPDFGDMFIVKR